MNAKHNLSELEAMEEGIGLPFKRVGVQDCFCEGGTTPYLMNKFGLDAPAIAHAVRGIMQRKKG